MPVTVNGTNGVTFNDSTTQSTASIPSGQAKAWVNFNGTTNTIRASYNVSSITNNGTGDNTVNFTNALADANYEVNISASAAFGSASVGGIQVNTTNAGTESAPTASAVRFTTINSGGSANINCKYVNVVVFR